MTAHELVVLVDEAGNHIGTCEKPAVHTSNTALHLAFSCYVLNDRGELLVTRRALTKQTWPGVWTNSFCGHPAPGERFTDAISRRAHRELGTTVTHITEVLKDFRYRAVDASGVVENEICPVFVAHLAGELKPAADEVAEWAWVRPDDLAAVILTVPFVLSPWLRDQLPELMHRDALRQVTAS